MKSKKIHSNECFLDPCLSKELRDVVNSSDIFIYEPEYKTRYNLICAVMDRMDSAIKYLSKYKDYPETEEDLITFMVFSCMLVDGIKKLSENIFHQKFYSTEKKYFLETQRGKYLYLKEKDFLSDDKMFEYFRSLIFAHPYNTDRYFKEYYGEQVSPWVYANKRFASFFNGIKDAIGIRVYTQKILSPDSQNDEILLEISFEKLKSYVNSRYLHLNKIIKWLKDEKFKVEEKWKSEKINRNLTPTDLIIAIDNYLNKRYINHYGIKEFYYYLDCPLTDLNNKKYVDIFRKAIIDKLPEVCDAAENLDGNKIFDISAELTKSPNKMHDEAGYQLEKIFSYLEESYNRSIPEFGSNEEWGLIQAAEFANGFAKKWVHIDPITMSNSEIKLLVAVACYMERLKQEKKKEK